MPRCVPDAARALAAVAPLMLAACGGSSPAPEPTPSQTVAATDLPTPATATATPPAATPAAASAPAPAASATPVADTAPPPVEPIPPGEPGGLPDDRTPVSEAPFAADSAQGAADVVQRYVALIGSRRYAAAWALWEDGGRASGMSRAAFGESFAGYAQWQAQVGAPGRIDAGAGQRHVEVPVQVYGRMTTGAPFHLAGTVVLHRTGDIDGATAAQRRWHISDTHLKPVNVAADRAERPDGRGAASRRGVGKDRTGRQ